MERMTTMVREYIHQHGFAADEQKFGLEGWSVESMVNPHAKHGLLTRIRLLFTGTPAHLAVTYHRPSFC